MSPSKSQEDFILKTLGPNLTANNFLERSLQAERIKEECSQFGKDKQASSLDQTVEKVRTLIRAFNRDVKETNQGAKLIPETRKAYLENKAALKQLTAQVNGLAATAPTPERTHNIPTPPPSPSSANQNLNNTNSLAK